MSDLIHQLTLGAGLNTEKKILSYLELSRSTWYRKLKSGRLSRPEFEALRHKAGYLMHGRFRDFRIVDDRIYSKVAGFATANEIDNMDFIRQFLDWAHRTSDERDRQKAGFQMQLEQFGS